MKRQIKLVYYFFLKKERDREWLLKVPRNVEQFVKTAKILIAVSHLCHWDINYHGQLLLDPNLFNGLHGGLLIYIYIQYACVFIAKHCNENKNKSNNIMMWKNVPTTNKKKQK